MRSIVKVVQEKKAENLISLDLRGIANFTDYFIICTAISRPHLLALVKNTIEKMSEKKIKPINSPEKEKGGWRIIDYGDVVVHFFDEPTRKYYQLERLWADGEMKVY